MLQCGHGVLDCQPLQTPPERLLCLVFSHSWLLVQCAAAVDNLAGYYFKHMPSSDSPTSAAAVSAWVGRNLLVVSR